MKNPKTAEQFQIDFPVSDDVLAKLKTYVDVLVKWQPKINLVGPDTIPNVWSRHILDSAQLAPLIEPKARVADLGSGAGFPGLVLAIMLKDVGIDMHWSKVISVSVVFCVKSIGFAKLGPPFTWTALKK